MVEPKPKEKPFSKADLVPYIDESGYEAALAAYMKTGGKK